MKKFILIVLLAILTITIIITYINLYALRYKHQVRIERLKRKRHNIKSEIHHLQIKIAKYSRIARIRRQAKKLNFHAPTLQHTRYITLDSPDLFDSCLTSSVNNKKSTKQNRFQKSYFWLFIFSLIIYKFILYLREYFYDKINNEVCFFFLFKFISL